MRVFKRFNQKIYLKTHYTPLACFDLLVQLVCPWKSIDRKENTVLFSTSNAEYVNKNNYQDHQPGGKFFSFYPRGEGWSAKPIRIQEKFTSCACNPLQWQNHVRGTSRRCRWCNCPPRQSDGTPSSDTTHVLCRDWIYHPDVTPALGVCPQGMFGSTSTSGITKKPSKQKPTERKPPKNPPNHTARSDRESGGAGAVCGGLR